MILLTGGSVFTSNGFIASDVLVDDTEIVGLGSDLHAASADVLDVSGCYIGPGFVDLHVHFREPGQTWKEDIESGSRAAVAGGFTAAVAMPNTEPPVDSAKLVHEIVDRGHEVGLIELSAAATLTKDRAGISPSDVEALYKAGVRMFTDDGDSVADGALLEDVMRRVVRLTGASVSQHCEDAERTADGQMNDGDLARSLGVPGLPASAEFDVVSRDLELARRTGAPYHCQHVSSSTSVEMIRRAKREGLQVTAEVTPHHLTFDESSLSGLDSNFKMYPPLRTAVDRAALRDALVDGTIDVVATDHAPHSPDEKDVPFEGAPRGVIGLETAASAVWESLRDPQRFFDVLSVRPADIGCFSSQGHDLAVGVKANLVVFDPYARWTPTTFRSKSQNSPYLGREMRGQVRHTISNGNLVYTAGSSR